MGLKKYKPRTASLRFTTLSDFEGVSKKRPERSLTTKKKSNAGRKPIDPVFMFRVLFMQLPPPQNYGKKFIVK